MSEDKADKQWLVAYVKMHHERKVGNYLDGLGVKTFLPIQKVTRQWSDRKKVIDKILIPMMIFVRVSPDERRIVLSSPSVLSFMMLRGTRKHAVIPDKEMQMFRFMLDSYDSDISIENEIPNIGDKVRIIKGPLLGLEGTLIGNEKGKLKFVLQLNQLISATILIDRLYVEKVH